MNKTLVLVLNVLLFQGFFKWIIAIVLIMVFIIGNPQVQEQMSKPTVYTYLASNCQAVGENMECTLR